MDKIIQVTIFPGATSDDIVLQKYNSVNEKDVDFLIEFMGYFITGSKFLEEYREDLLLALAEDNYFLFYKNIKNMAKRCLKKLEVISLK